MPLCLEQCRAEPSDPDDEDDEDDMANDNGEIIEGPTVLAHVELAKTIRMSIHISLPNPF